MNGPADEAPSPKATADTSSAAITVSAGATAPPEQPAYIRGGRTVEVDGRRVAVFALGAVLAAMTTIALVLAAQANGTNARINRLHGHGVPVEATVTDCLGLATGTGITAAGYSCRGTFTLDGRRYTDVIAGTSALHAPGERLAAVTDPADPSVLSTGSALATARVTWTGYLMPTILLAVVVTTLAGWRFRRRRAQAPSAPEV